MTRCAAFAIVVVHAVGSIAFAQDVNLAEIVVPGDVSQCSVDLDLKGSLLFVVEGQNESVRLEAKARHVFTERVLAVAQNMPTTSARLYTDAVASAVVSNEKMDRTLPANRRLVIARRNPDGLLCFTPAGPLTRDELDLVTEHFNPQCLAGLLPGKVVKVDDTWKVPEATVHAACLFDVVITANLTGKLTSVKDGVATFTVQGMAEGIENGAKVIMNVNATGTFDIATSRVMGLSWTQKDQREQGPVNPASQVEATVTLKRAVVKAAPQELADDAVGKFATGEIPASQTLIRHDNPKGRYTLLHDRNWHATGQTDSHVVLRLLHNNEFAAQATISIWKKLGPGQHSPADEFKKAVGAAPGWVPTKVLAEGEVSGKLGHWLYRVAAEGKMDKLPVIQSFYLLAGPQGDQVVVTVAMKPEQAKIVGTRDLDLVKGIDFGRQP